MALSCWGLSPGRRRQHCRPYHHAETSLADVLPDVPAQKRFGWLSTSDPIEALTTVPTSLPALRSLRLNWELVSGFRRDVTIPPLLEALTLTGGMAGPHRACARVAPRPPLHHPVGLGGARGCLLVGAPPAVQAAPEQHSRLGGRNSVVVAESNAVLVELHPGFKRGRRREKRPSDNREDGTRSRQWGPQAPAGKKQKQEGDSPWHGGAGRCGKRAKRTMMTARGALCDGEDGQARGCPHRGGGAKQGGSEIGDGRVRRRPRVSENFSHEAGKNGPTLPCGFFRCSVGCPP